MSQVLGAAVGTQFSTDHYTLILERILLPVDVSESWTQGLWHSLWAYLTKPLPSQRILSLKVVVLVPRALAERHDDGDGERWFLNPGHSQRLRVLSITSIGDMHEPKAESATLVEPERWPWWRTLAALLMSHDLEHSLSVLSEWWFYIGRVFLQGRGGRGRVFSEWVTQN